ncbi:MAG: thioredoxin-like domain-containing protein [Bacteroidota bacterium]
MSKLTLIPFLFINTAYAQEKQFPFHITGTINADSGIVAIDLFYDHDYYPKGVEKMEAEVKDKKFSFKGNISYPQAFTISYGQQYSSRLFVIEPGDQSMTVDIDANRGIPSIDNKAMREYEDKYAKAYEEVRRNREAYRTKKDSLRQFYNGNIPESIQLELETEIKTIYAAGDSVLLKYVTRHPSSYIALWKFIELFSFDGYSNLFASIHQQFSDSLKQAYAGKVLTEKLTAAGLLAIGKRFPALTAIDSENHSFDRTLLLENKYTLIDFWYSNCRPCIAQFPHLKDMYDKYKDRGFEIVGISTDRERYKEQWLKAIERYQLSWPQYWDKNGKAALGFSINKFPTNYLLDSQGRIIKKDQRPVELDQFLQENM